MHVQDSHCLWHSIHCVYTDSYYQKQWSIHAFKICWSRQFWSIRMTSPLFQDFPYNIIILLHGLQGCPRPIMQSFTSTVAMVIQHPSYTYQQCYHVPPWLDTCESQQCLPWWVQAILVSSTVKTETLYYIYIASSHNECIRFQVTCS